MKTDTESFSKDDTLHKLKHFLPSQAPLKDFIHHNTLHAFQELQFDEALGQANEIFGYKVYLSLDEYRELYSLGKIKKEILDRILVDRYGAKTSGIQEQLFNTKEPDSCSTRIGKIRSFWKSYYKIDLDSLVHPILFRIVGSYLDQGVSIWNFPHNEKGFLSSLRELEINSLVSFFKTDHARELLINETFSLEFLLEKVVGKSELYEHYIFDQQFAHSGWSGMVSVLDDNPNLLLDKRPINIEELIIFELLLEIDALDDHFGNVWAPLGVRVDLSEFDLFKEVEIKEETKLKSIWQEAYEWSYYDEVLAGVGAITKTVEINKPSFQALFCIDDRECSIRRYVEKLDPHAATFGTAGFFNVEFFFQPKGGKFYTKVCPAPLTPKYLIKEKSDNAVQKKDLHFGKHSHGLFGGYLMTLILGFWSGFKLFLTVFKPAKGEASVSSFDHMDPESELTIEFDPEIQDPNGLQVGFTVVEMADRLEGLLRSIGLLENFANIIYSIGHGSSSVNNTHYAGYDCGACSGRPGSVNARVISYIGNHKEVRNILKERGINIPDSTVFVGALHDTSKDAMQFYDLSVLSVENHEMHLRNELIFNEALNMNARERSRRFLSIDSKGSPSKVHRKVQKRTVSLFEPRPELNHATNALCLVGRREFSKQIFLDRRAFLNSYDFKKDPNGNYLLGILNAVAPVCGGINLEYFFSRMDNQQLGAGTKLPHNVMGLIGVANGIDGDLRTGLPSQMIEVHDPLRLMVIVEQNAQVVLDTILKNPATYQWFEKDWVKLCAVDPISRKLFVFNKGSFTEYIPLHPAPPVKKDMTDELLSTHENIPVYLLNAI